MPFSQKDALAILALAPCQYLLQDVDPRAGMAPSVIDLGMRIESHPFCGAQLCQDDFLMNVEK